MKKIIKRTRRFEKSFGKLNIKTQKLFIKKLGIFIDDEYAASLGTNQLKGKRRNEYAFSVTNDIRAICEKRSRNGKEILVFTFVDIGGHSKVY